MSKSPFGFPLLLAALLLASCQPGPVLNEKKTLDRELWGYADTLDFQLQMKDTSLHYDLFLDLAHTPEFPTQNLYIRIYTRFPDGERVQKLVSLELADKAGQWYGRCSGQNCRLTIPLQQGALFDQPGAYTFTLEQYTRINPLPGLKEIGMRIQQSSK